MKLVELANRYGSTIEASNGTLTVDAKSIMSVMRLAAGKGTVLRITADGDDAQRPLRPWSSSSPKGSTNSKMRPAPWAEAYEK